MEGKRSALVLTVVVLGLVLPLAVTPTPVRREARSPEKNLEDTAVSTFNVTTRLSEDTGSGDGSGTNTTSQPPAVSLAGTGYITNGTKEISDSHEVRIKLIQSSTVPPETPHPQVLPVKSEDVPALPIPLDDQGNYTILTSLGSSNESVEVEPPVQNCSEVLEYDSLIPVLKCPNVKAFHNALQKEPLKRGSVNVEIERVDGALFLSSATGLVLMCLKVSNANITAITLQDKQPQMLQSLKSLDLSDNPAFDAKSLNALGRLPSLTHLYLRGTALSSLELQLPELLQNLPNLQYLDLSSSGIHHLSESTSTQNMKLNHLDVSGNRLFHVTLSEVVVSQLKHLNMSGCGLRNIRVMESPAVRTTPLKVHQNLRVLDVSDNLLTDLPRLLLNNLAPECVVLDITKNSWSHACNKCSLYYLWQYLTTLPEDVSKCSEIKGMEDVLCFNRNEALLTCGWDDCPKGCQCDKWKKIVDCTDIGLESIPLVGPSSAEVLLVQFNSLQNLSGIESPSWCNLKHLHADRNRITTLLPPGINGSCSCKSEDHYDDQNTCFPLNLKELVLNNNTLQSVTSTDCSILYPLQTLKLARNMVNSPVAQVCGSLENLKVLDLSHNNLTNFYEPDFASYPHLKKLIVHHNKLTHLQPDVTSLMHELQFLDLSHNSLENIHDHFSAPDTIFSDMGSSNLKELLLHNNKLSSVKYVLSLTVIPSLTKVTLHDNPWDCNCSNIGQLKDNIFVKKNTPLYEAAMEDMECKTPYENERMAVSDLLNEECRQGSTDQLFMTSMACFLILCICILICYSRQWKYCYGRCKPGYNASQPAVTRRKYDCFVVSSSRDFELLRQNVIIPLTQRGYSIAWHDNAFRPGYWIMDNVERAVRNSARMLVFATDNLVTSRWGRQEIRRGRHEEFSCSDYKIMALVTETLPRELNRDLYEIVALRTHVLLSDRDYIDQICNFLPQPAPFANRPDGVYMTDSNIQALLQKYEELKQMKRQENTPISELFHTHHEQNRVTINVDIATVSNSSMCSAAEQEKRSNVIQRFKVSPVAALPSPPASSDTTSLKYCLVDQDNDDDMNDIELSENFERRTYKRISCRF